MTYRYDDIPVTSGGVLTGTPDCPLCFHVLRHHSMPDVGEEHWHCPNCGWWETDELIAILMKDEGE